MTFVPIRCSLLLAVCLQVVPFAVSASTALSLQPPVGARIDAPRRVAATSGGQLAVIDYRGRLSLLTKRGDLVAMVFEGARAVTAGGGNLFVATEDARIVTLDEQTGKVRASIKLGLAEGPVGLSYDAGRNLVWMAFRSGMVQARRPDGTVALQPTSAATGGLVDLVDLAVDSGAGLVWVAQGGERIGGSVFGLGLGDGARAKVVGADGQGPAKIAGALAVGADGRLFVSDLFNGKVAVIGADGAALPPVALPAAATGRPAQPAGLAFMANGDLLVASLNTGLVRFGDGAPLPVCSGDADCDGMSDPWEAGNRLDSANPSDALADADGDGLTNVEEFGLGTNPNSTDSDGDGYADGVEVASGFNPADPLDHVPAVVTSAGEFAPGKVTLAASLTNVGEGGACTASWKQTGGAAVTLTGADGLAPSFVARAAGVYRFSVVATCGGVTSAPATVAATILNVAPVPSAQRALVVLAGERAVLSAQRSSDANGDALVFGWEQLSGPAVLGSSGGAVVSPRLSAPGAYRFKVTVADRAGATSEAVVDAVALGAGQVPVAAAASPVVGAVGVAIALDASASHRSAAATFSWRQVAGVPVQLAGASGPVASFVPAAKGRYAFAVEIVDGGLASPPATVEVFVGDGQLPVAVATAPSSALVGTAVALDGSGSLSSLGGLEHAWRQVSGPAAGLGAASAPIASAWLFKPGSYEFELSVKDGAGTGVPARVRVEARKNGSANPVARVSAPASATVGQVVVLDGSASTGAGKFHWTQLGGPWVALGADAVESFRPQTAGTYVFELEVDDGPVRSAPVRTVVVVSGDERVE